MVRSFSHLVLLSFLTLAACSGGEEAPMHPPEDAELNAGDGNEPGTNTGTAADGVSATPRKPVFPLHVSGNGRYLVDDAGHPFLINQASSWGLIQSLSTEDARSYLDQLAGRGWNTVMVSIISYDERMPGDPPSWRGNDPFTVRWDFSKPNEAYFKHADEILKLARERGMLVTLVPSYLGFPDDPTQGWADELQSGNNSVEKSRTYGRYLGKRYKSFDNIVWIAGGDNQPAQGSALEAHMRAIVEGIRSEDPDHLWTAHWDGMDEGTVSSENASFAQYLDLDGYYAFNYPLTYEKDLATYARHNGRPLFHLDMSYETEWGGAPAEIRRRAYDAMLSGAMGSSFNAGPDWYLFRNFRNMGTPGARETQHWFRFFARLPWHELSPDLDHSAITSGFGERGSSDYVCAARTPDYRVIVAYLPHGGSVTANLGKLPRKTARVNWFDPAAGKWSGASDLQAQGSKKLSAPSAQSWVLLVESK
ncbi:MAG TPA: DUF4038 domain-containing protein [Polyangiales bacterium]|nr:DUF4038 domain-containing protein [Polyangiales bacterium]